MLEKDILANWYNNDIIRFEDEQGSIFTKGPFKIDGTNYDYKLQVDGNDDESNIDYCTTSQMLFWEVTSVNVLERSGEE